MRGKQDHSRERNLRRAQTDAEARLWNYLRDRRLEGYKFRRQHRIGRYFVDLVCAEASLIVELDGGQHAERESYDAARTTALEVAGYRVLRPTYLMLRDEPGKFMRLVRERLAT